MNKKYKMMYPDMTERFMKRLTSSRMTLIYIVIVSLFLNFYDLEEYPLNPDEAVYSSQAAIWAGHDNYKQNFMLHSRSATNFQIHQLITSMSFRFFGINEFNARLPTVIMGVLLVPLIYLLASTMFNSRAGLFSAFFTAINGYLLHFNRQVHLDTPLVFFIVLAILCLVKWRKTKANWFFYVLLISTLLASMIKIVAIVILAILILFYLYLEKELKPFVKMLFRPVSILIMFSALLYITYFIISIVGLDEFKNTFSYAVSRQSKYTYTFYIDIIISFVGYLIPIIASIGAVQALKYRRNEDLFCAFWLIFVALFFSFYPLKAYSYMLPIVPAICLLNGKVLDDLTNKLKKFRLITITILLIVVLISIYPTFNYSYGTPKNLNEVEPGILSRLDIIKFNALRDAGLWLRTNSETDSTVAINKFSSHHILAFYSNLETYTVDNYPGFYMPVNGTATPVWTKVDILQLIKDDKIDYVVYMGESFFGKKISKLKKQEHLKFIPFYYRHYDTPKWYQNGSLNVTIYKVVR